MTEQDKQGAVGNAKEFIASYWNTRANAFLKLRQQEFNSNKNPLWLREITDKVLLLPQMKILDVGCGTGFFSLLLAKQGAVVTGIDLSPEMIAKSQAWAKAEKQAIDFRVMDAEQLVFPDNTFDLVISRNVTWDLPHPIEAYRQWLRVLKPGGTLLNYDGEYAKDFAKQKAGLGVNRDITLAQMEQCHTIYQMLSISGENRPVWDERVLRQLTGKRCKIDKNVSKRLYAVNDAFDSGTPIFCVAITK